MKIYYPISVDLYNQYPLQVITAQQANIGRGVMLTLTANNAVLVPENESLFVYVKKPDATKVYADCVLSGNQVQIDFTQQMLAVPGMLEAELQLIDASGNNITTPIFLIDNQASNIDYTALESSDEFKAFVDALAEVEYYREHGLVGPPGEAATITVGDVEASAPGSAPQVTNSGTSQNAVLNFTLPRGEPGSVWYFGTAITGTETSGTVFPDSGIEDAKEYDKYVNTDTGNIYDCSMAGGASTAQWTYIGSIMGPAGATQIVFAAYSNFPETGEPGKIYVDTDTTDELVIWRWTGTEYVTTEHGALEMIADGLDPDESYVVNDYFIQGNKFRKVTTAFGPGEYDDSKTEMTTVAAELKSQNSKIEGINSSFHVISKSGKFAGQTTAFYTGVSITIPAKSFYVLSGSANWSSTAPQWVGIASNDTINTSQYAEGQRSESIATCTIAGYVEKETTFYLWAKYPNTTENEGYFAGFYVTQEDSKVNILS